MSYTHFYKQLQQIGLAEFPSLKGQPDAAWDHLISPIELRLPKSVYANAEAAIKALFAVSRRAAFAGALDARGVDAGGGENLSVLMAYDFHSDEAGNAYLVEVNTNASGFLLSTLMELAHEPRPLEQYPPLRALGAAFAAEAKSPRAQIAIVDEDLEQQKMYVEFLLYRDWLTRLGFGAELCDSQSLTFDGQALRTAAGTHVDLVYNRATDFFLEEPAHAALRRAYLAGKAVFSPNPREYWLLADKQRLIQMSEPDFLERVGASPAERAAIAAVLIPTFEKARIGTPDEIWAKRRALFFKPKNSFGGKSVYRGESVSRKVFERLMREDILIQNFQPAQKVPVEDDRSVLSTWKFDLRFYVYGDQIQLVVARIYQGQVTNFSSPMGGFTLVRFV